MNEVSLLQKLLKTSETSLKDSSYAAEKTKSLLAANKAAADSILLRLQRELSSSLDSQVVSIEICSSRTSYDE